MAEYLTYDELDEDAKENAYDNLIYTKFMYKDIIDMYSYDTEALAFGDLASNITVDYDKSYFGSMYLNEDYATIYGDWLASDIVNLEDDEEFTNFVEKHFGLDNTVHCEIADVANNFYDALYGTCKTEEDEDELDEVWSDSFQDKLDDMYHTFVEYMYNNEDDEYIAREEIEEVGNNGYIVFDEDGNPFYAESGKPVE